MKAKPAARLIVAVGLTVALPTVTAAQLVLDARAASHRDAGIETKHGQPCRFGHNHLLCTLTSHTPWSTPPSRPLWRLVVPPSLATPPAIRRAVGGGAARLTLARAPPPLT